MAATSPAWASETTSLTPESPLALRPARKPFQPSSLSVSMASTPRTCLRPSAPSPIAVTTAWEETTEPSLQLM